MRPRVPDPPSRPAAPWWPLAVGLALLGSAFAGLLALSLRLTGDGFTYAIDDAYIHLSIARNFAASGEWGLGGQPFVGGSSSPLWILLLALVERVVGDHVLTPLVLDVACAALVLAVAHVILARRGMGPLGLLGVQVALVLAVPLAPLVFSGMEHLLQTALALAFVALAAEALEAGRPTRGQTAWLLALAFLLTGLRYEDAVLVGVVAVAAWLRGWRALAVGLLAVGAAPAFLYGAWSMAHGWPFLPTSMIAKADPLRGPMDVVALGHRATKRLLGAPHVLVMILVALGLLAGRAQARRPWRFSDVLLAVFAATASLHFIVGRWGWFFRYEAYLVALGVVALALALHESRPWPVRPWRDHAMRLGALALLATLVALPVAMRTVDAYHMTPLATDDIHDQQFTIARFLRDHYAGRTVAMNDIGAPSYYGGVQIIDLWGLADQEMARAWRDGLVTPELVRERTQAGNASIAILHESLFNTTGGLPPEWIPVGRWTLDQSVVAGSPIVTFYAIDPAEAPRLRAALEAFAPRLPPDETWTPIP